MFEQIELNEESMVYHTCCGVTSQAEIKLDSLSVTAKAEFKLVNFLSHLLLGNITNLSHRLTVNQIVGYLSHLLLGYTTS